MKEVEEPLLPVHKYEELIEGLLSDHYGLVDDFIDPALVVGLRDNLLRNRERGEMHAAGIGKHFSFTRNLKIRGDKIHWIDKKSTDKYERAFNAQIQDFIKYLNRTCYTGINDFEFHYAYYDAGSFYQRHKDQFKSDQGRKFSLVTYLNDDWRPEDEGNLILYLEDEEVNILPRGGRAVFFKSDEVEHEVKPSNRTRMSIAGWLKRV